jgi:hypothetical protein
MPSKRSWTKLSDAGGWLDLGSISIPPHLLTLHQPRVLLDRIVKTAKRRWAL